MAGIPVAGPSKQDVTALILAAGEGTRLGGVSKAFLSYRGGTVLEHAADLALSWCSRALIGVSAPDKARAADVLSGRAAEILEGGASRQETVGVLLDRAETEWVLVHDAARPFAPPGLFARLFGDAAAHGAVVPMTRVISNAEKSRDRIAHEKDGFLSEAGRAVALQTPQLYRRDMLVDVYRKARGGGWRETSTATLTHRAGIAVRLIAGEPGNVKLTYPEDLKLLSESRSR